MNYEKHYNLLITRAQNRKLTGYSELHHIIPKCLGGKDAVTNLVALTAPEHFLAHQLLVKIYPGNRDLILAVHMMTVSTAKFSGARSKNKRFGWIRELTAKAQEGTIFTEERKAKIRKAKVGSTLSEDHKQNISKGLIGTTKSEETRLKIAEAGRKYREENKDKLAPTHECEHCKKLFHSWNLPRHKIKCYAKLTKVKQKRMSPIVQCPHCRLSGQQNVMKRWHFDKCKSRKEIV
jgi:hypothetical protein